MSRFPNGLLLIGVEDGSFKAFLHRKSQKCPLCAVRMIDNKIEDIKASKIAVDGLDATSKLSEMLRDQVFHAIILGGITFAGFNIIDAQRIYKELSRPLIVFTRSRPNNEIMREALQKHFDDWRRRWSIIESLGQIYSTYTRPREPPVYFEVVGEKARWAEEVLKRSASLCRIPEPVRVARLVARGLSITCG